MTAAPTVALLACATAILVAGQPPVIRLGSVAGTAANQAPGEASEQRARAFAHGLFSGRAVVPITIGGVVLALGLVYRAIHPTTIAAAVILAATGAHVVRDWINERRDRRRDREVAEFLGHVVARLRAGSLPAPAIEATLDIAGTAVSHEIAGGLRALAADRKPAPGAPGVVRDLAPLWRASARHGVSLADLLEQYQLRLDSACRRASSAAAGLTGPQSSAAVLSALPIVGIGLGGAMGAHPLSFLCGGGLGGVVLLVGVAFLCSGILWSQAIIRAATREER